METSKLLDAEFKTLVIRMLKELGRHFNSIKMIQSEMREALTEIKNNLQGNNSMDEAKKQIKHLEHKEQKTAMQNKKKKESKKMGMI